MIFGISICVRGVILSIFAMNSFYWASQTPPREKSQHDIFAMRRITTILTPQCAMPRAAPLNFSERRCRGAARLRWPLPRISDDAQLEYRAPAMVMIRARSRKHRRGHRPRCCFSDDVPIWRGMAATACRCARTCCRALMPSTMMPGAQRISDARSVEDVRAAGRKSARHASFKFLARKADAHRQAIDCFAADAPRPHYQGHLPGGADAVRMVE